MNIVQPSPAAQLSPELIARFRAIVGDKYAMTDAADIAPYVTEERNLFHGYSPLVLRPASTAEASAICKLATQHRIALVPQGGNTGLVGGQTPHHGEGVLARPASCFRSRSSAPPRWTDCFHCRSARRGAAPSAAIFPPMRGAPRRWPMAWRARWRSASKWCWPMAAS